MKRGLWIIVALWAMALLALEMVYIYVAIYQIKH